MIAPLPPCQLPFASEAEADTTDLMPAPVMMVIENLLVKVATISDPPSCVLSFPVSNETRFTGPENMKHIGVGAGI